MPRILQIAALALLIASGGAVVAAPKILTELNGTDRDKCDRPGLPPDETISFCTVMIRMGIDNPPGAYHYPRTALANQTLHAGLAFRQKGDEDAAKKYFSAAVLVIADKMKNFPTNSKLLGERCWIRAAANFELDAGLTDCDASLKNNPDDPEVLRNKGFILYRQGKYQEALSAYTASVAKKSDDPYVLFLRGVNRQKLGDVGADEDLKAAEALNRNVPTIFKNYAVISN